MAAISSVRRVGNAEYEVAIDWRDGRRTYVVAVHEEAGMRAVKAPDALYAEWPRCPMLTKLLVPVVLTAHDGEHVALPVEIPELGIG